MRVAYGRMTRLSIRIVRIIGWWRINRKSLEFLNFDVTLSRAKYMLNSLDYPLKILLYDYGVGGGQLEDH